MGCEDPLEEEMAIHSSIPAWEILWAEEPGQLQSTGSQRVGHTTEHTKLNAYHSSECCTPCPLERLRFHFSLSCSGGGNGNPLQCSCLESPRDGGAWWAAIYGVTQSRTRLKQLSKSSLCLVFSSGTFTVLDLIFRSFMDFEWIFVYGVR